MNTCTEPGCTRKRMESSSGFRYALCESCVRRLLGAFAPVAWHERAKAGTLPPQIVGGRTA